MQWLHNNDSKVKQSLTLDQGDGHMWQESGFTNLDSDELRAFMDERKEADYVLVDVRQPGEYTGGHIPGAKHVPLGKLEDALTKGEFKSDRAHVFYCAGGVRSRAASRLAVESGLFAKGVFNLDKGFRGWNGMALPDSPRLKIFEDAKSVEDMLVRALGLEKAAHYFYKTISESSDNTILCELMARLVDMEMAHARMVYKQLEMLKGDVPPFEEMFEAAPADVLEGGRTLKDLKPWIESAKSGDCLELAELGMEIEFSAFDLYRALANETDTPAIERIFLSLAEEEKKHVRLLFKNLDGFLDPEVCCP